MAAEFKINVDLADVASACGDIINESVFPLLAQAVRAVAEQTRINWMESVQRAKLWSVEKDEYTASIQLQFTGPFSALVWTDYKYAEEIESGRPSRDLKKMLDTSEKVRRTKDGKRYLIIPFRHGTPGTNQNPMPQAIYAMSKKLAPSRIIGQTKRVSGLEASSIKTRGPIMVPQNLYKWGERLRGSKSKPIDKKYESLYRFNAETPGGRRYSTYMTFRVMMEGSPGWIVPPKPGLNIAQRVATQMAPLAESAFKEAMSRDF